MNESAEWVVTERSEKAGAAPVTTNVATAASLSRVWRRWSLDPGQTTVHTCVVHPVRSARRYCGRPDRLAAAKDLKAIYSAPTVPLAEEALFGELADQWGARCPVMISSWETTWNEHFPFLELPPGLRAIVSTTNAFESLSALSRLVGEA